MPREKSGCDEEKQEAPDEKSRAPYHRSARSMKRGPL
jgi:hypothetical protein